MRKARVDTTAASLTALARQMGKRHKFGAVATVVDGIRFHSKAEAQRYGELKLLEKAGEIGLVVRQPKYPLSVDKNEIGAYVADFSYWDRRRSVWVVEDVKGFMTPLAKWKIKHAEAQYGITVEIVK